VRVQICLARPYSQQESIRGYGRYCGELPNTSRERRLARGNGLSTWARDASDSLAQRVWRDRAAYGWTETSKRHLIPRYIRNPPSAHWSDDKPLVPDLRVDLSEPQETGLFDHDGNKLFKLPDEIGFLKETKTNG